MVSAENKATYESIASKLPSYWEIDGRVMEIGAVTDRELCLQAQEIAADEMRPLYTEITAELVSIMDAKVDRGNSQSTMLSILCLALAVAAAVMIVIALLSSNKLAKNIAVKITVPLQELGERLESFAKGDLFNPFPTVDTDDEIGDMIKSANDMAEALDFIISDVEYTLGEMANSNYTVRSRDGSRYIGDFKQLFDSSKKLRDGMVETMKFIEQSSIQVTEGSNNLSETSLSLAEGATEQASAVEELQATITTISEAAKLAADNAEQAYHQSQEYADVANNSSADIRAMVDAMERINEASMKIGNIISEIESIASQTNLLSLNA
ncbi:MAG: methyl-accepting chemotaxis protein, partial [Lachnospiraceae bacterium]|nr:methyl-accepting chemotaxis protein [Lachnospiraceae bacterium]